MTVSKDAIAKHHLLAAQNHLQLTKSMIKKRVAPELVAVAYYNGLDLISMCRWIDDELISDCSVNLEKILYQPNPPHYYGEWLLEKASHRTDYRDEIIEAIHGQFNY